ncbi:flagellar motor protein [Myxococcota bacterium]|nr:flagellar motor protein [Myxococcota bacterium]
MDLATIAGIIVALVAVLGGQALEGGSVGSILQPTAALIVFGGTLGAVAVQFPFAVLRQAAIDLRQVFRPDTPDLRGVVDAIVRLATKARREGLVAIEEEVEELADPYLRRGLQLAVDGTDAKVIRAAMELELGHWEEEQEAPAKVLEAAGGYSPTIGILGAVLGLIHVMENLSDPGKLGSGIAVAFVATVYGVGFANLFFLPMAQKMKLRVRQKVVMRELMIEGVVSLAEGENPRLIERRLSVFVTDGHAPDKADAATPERPEAAPAARVRT